MYKAVSDKRFSNFFNIGWSLGVEKILSQGKNLLLLLKPIIEWFYIWIHIESDLSTYVRWQVYEWFKYGLWIKAQKRNGIGF